MTRQPRVVGVDVARALASLIMVQGHAYHAWVADPYRDSASYLFTRVLGSLPLPAFLLLAGASMALRVRAAIARGESADAMRHSLMRRGASLVLWGYGVNLAFALLDGADGLATLLRVDVLHVIGLSLFTTAWLGIRAAAGTSSIDLTALRKRALLLSVAPPLLCPWLVELAPYVPRGLAPAAALWIDIPAFTRMPWVPLSAWLTLGVLLATSRGLLPLEGGSPFARRAGTPPRRAMLLTAGALLVAVAGAQLTEGMLRAWGGTLTRSHPAVVANVIDLAGRGALVLALGLWLGGLVPERLGAYLARIGRSSLWIYVAHLPLCYGRPGRVLFHQLSMLEASLWLLPLLASSVALGLWRGRPRTQGSARAAPAVS